MGSRSLRQQQNITVIEVATFTHAYELNAQAKQQHFIRVHLGIKSNNPNRPLN